VELSLPSFSIEKAKGPEGGGAESMVDY